MAFRFAERTLETSTSVGTGPMVLDGPLSGYQAFSTTVGQGNETYYSILNEADDTWEVGIGTFISGELNRDALLASSTGGFVNFAVGTKRVFASVAAQFINDTLTLASHSAIDHTGLPGIPLPEAFTSAAHEGVDHTAPPFNILDQTTHASINHKIPPLSLIDVVDHGGIDHTGLPGVNAFDVLAHAAVLHAGIPGIPPAEAFTMAVHTVTDHAGIPGIGATPVPDVAAETVIATAATDNPASSSLSVNINLPSGSTWTVMAYGAFMSQAWPSGSGNFNLTIDGQIVASIQPDGDNPTGAEYYALFGARTGRSSGLRQISINIPAGGFPVQNPRNARIFALGIREA